jgi:FkbM family methyltransferase
MSDFYREVFSLWAKAVNNFYPDNFDWEIRRIGVYRRAMILFERLARAAIRAVARNEPGVLIVSRQNYFLQNIEKFEHTYELLMDENSRKKFIELLLYKMLGFTKVKLSLNTGKFWAARAGVAAYRRAERIPVNFRNSYLDLYDLSDAGYDLKLFFVNNGIYVDFILQQYNYRDIVCVGPDEVVIDAGGCWGDTALYFAARGAARIFVYEFIPSNIAILRKNLSLNRQYADRISVVEKAVWESSKADLSYQDQGPSSRVAEAGMYSGTTQTLSIDDLVQEQALTRVDFIKMDVEGAEMAALKGAANTIRGYKPKLAISVYHKRDDLILIPAYIQSLNPEYDFYLDYYTIIGDEIVLYAISNHAA